MAVLSIRNLPEHVKDCLRVRAARAGHSMEAEARAILAAACTDDSVPILDPSSVQDWVDSLYGDAKPRDVVGDLRATRKGEATK